MFHRLQFETNARALVGTNNTLECHFYTVSFPNTVRKFGESNLYTVHKNVIRVNMESEPVPRPNSESLTLVGTAFDIY